MAINEENSSLKGSNQPQLHQQGVKGLNQLEKNGKPVKIIMTLNLFNRRKTMLIWYYSGRLNPEAIKELAKTFGCTVRALVKDWVNRENWEPFIWEQQKATEDAKDTLKFLQLARAEALYLMETCRHPIARVSAIRRFTEVINTEIELKQSLGILPRANMAPTIVQQNNIGGSAALMIKGVFWENPELKQTEEEKKDEKTA